MRREGSSGWAAAAETDVAHSEAADWARACRYPARICPVADAVMRPLTKSRECVWLPCESCQSAAAVSAVFPSAVCPLSFRTRLCITALVHRCWH